MKYSAEQYASALFEALSEVGPKDHNTVIENFITVLQKQNELEHYESIIEAYERLDKEKRGIQPATVTLAREMKLSGELLEELNGLAKKKLEITTQVDESIIGGVVIRMDDTLIDASVKTQLEQLKNSLLN